MSNQAKPLNTARPGFWAALGIALLLGVISLFGGFQ